MSNARSDCFPRPSAPHLASTSALSCDFFFARTGDGVQVYRVDDLNIREIRGSF